MPCYTQQIPDLNGAAVGAGESAQTTPPTTIGNATQLVDTAAGPLQPVINSLVTDLTGLADQLANNGSTGQILGTVTSAAGQVVGGMPVGGTARLRSGPTTKKATARTAKAKAKAKSTARARQRARVADDDVAGQLLSRLNPFRGMGGQG